MVLIWNLPGVDWEPVQVWPEPQYYQIRGDAGYCLGPLLTSGRWMGFKRDLSVNDDISTD